MAYCHLSSCSSLNKILQKLIAQVNQTATKIRLIKGQYETEHAAAAALALAEENGAQAEGEEGGKSQEVPATVIQNIAPRRVSVSARRVSVTT